RSFANFFRYSSEAHSGSFEFDMDAFLPFLARRPRLSGWKSGSLTVEDLSGVGSTLYADRRPPFRPCRNLTTTLTAIRATRPAEPSGAVTSVRTTVDRKRSSGPLDEELASEFGVHLSSRESENPQVSRRNRSSAYESRN